ncbi:MAG: VOC family protein, partial [Candidatus Binatia bacterium]|nr:VOC family protein [Candidatus Binatia bacterium]
MIHPERIAHVVIKVRDLERSRAFYTEILGMQVMKDVPQLRACFLSFNGRDHHEVALIEIGPQAETPKANHTGLLHVAFRL